MDSEKDNCSVCHGTKGGVKGNENRISYMIGHLLVCDYCHSDKSYLAVKAKLDKQASLPRARREPHDPS